MTTGRSVQCARCGSRRVRRAHTPDGWVKFVRQCTPLRRYACGTCGFRGWTLHLLAVVPQHGIPSAMPSRPLEARDLRQRYTRRRSLLRAVIFAALLGAMVGFLFVERSAP